MSAAQPLAVALLRLGLEVDASVVAAMVLDGRADQVDAYLDACGYHARYAAWRAAS